MKFQQNDGGRSVSKRPKQRNDCVVRALAIAQQLSYDNVYEVLADLGRASGRATKRVVWEPYMQGFATKRTFPAIAGQKRMTIAAFAEQHQTGRHIVKVAKHVVAVIDGVVHDDVPLRRDACVYFAYTLN